MDKKIPGRNPPEPVERRPELDWWQRLRLWWGEPPLPAGVNGPPPPGPRPEPPPMPLLAGRCDHKGKRGPVQCMVQYEGNATSRFWCAYCGETLGIMGPLSKPEPTPVPPLDDADAAIQAIAIVEQILAKLEHVPCMSEGCDGVEDCEPPTKHWPMYVRCHRCEAIRLAKSVLHG